MKPIILIPARMASTRLPDKPLADIGGKPMIVHVYERAVEANVGPVYVAAGEQVIVDAVTEIGGNAVLTNPDHPSGTDRINEALQLVDPEKTYDVVINVQGDLPTLAPHIVHATLTPLSDANIDIATLVAPIETEAEATNPNVVKAIVEFDNNNTIAIASDFIRQPPKDKWPLYHHIGMYAYRRDALERFTQLPPSEREKEEKLEQLRALDNGMTIAAVCVDMIPFGVDTEDDLVRAREILQVT